jgi:hypothetical protein
MEIVILLAAMVVVGLIMTYVARLIWKEEMPVSGSAAYLVGVAAAIITGLLDWVVIPAMGFSDTLKYLGVATEPPLVVLLVFWIIKRARS